MSKSSASDAGAAGRYATALFQLAAEGGELDRVDADLGAVADALAASADLRDLIASPLYSRDDQGRALAALADAMDLSRTTRNVLGLLAQKRRIQALAQVIAEFRALLARHRGEVAAEVTAARPLSDAQTTALMASLRAALGREVSLSVTVDPGLIAGLVVKVGSKMIDTSVRTKLANLKYAMKEVG